MSKIDLGAKSILFPMPVLIIGTYDAAGKPNAMNAAWGMISDANEITMSLSEHKSTDNIKVTGAFTVGFGTEATMVPCDYVGVESANDVPDKFARAHFTDTKSEYVNAPVINELPVTLECKVKSFNDGILVGEIVNVLADEDVMTAGKIDLKKVKPITYDPISNNYYALGEKVGNAFSDGNVLKK